MKKFILSALAATVAMSPIAMTAAEAAPYQQTTVVKHKANGRTVIVQKQTNRYGQAQNFRKWGKGQRFDRRYAQNYRQIDYRQYRGRHLYAPPRGYQWVQSGNDAVLIAVTSGLIGAVLSGALR
jgi:Ni/Co efflux regulator RcnB